MDAFVTHTSAPTARELRRRPWATSRGRTCPSTTRWPTPSPSATPTTARCSGRPTPTGSCRSRAPSTPPASPVGPCSRRHRPQHYGTFTWKTMPERLIEAGVALEGLQRPDGPARLARSPISRFSPTRRRRGAELRPTAMDAEYPSSFQADVLRARCRRCAGSCAPGRVRAPRHGAAVWRVPGAEDPRHPRLQPRRVGPHAVPPGYDENGGFFDHVAPPTRPRGRPASTSP